MRIGIDASNIRPEGGGGTYLIQTLAAADPPRFGIDQVVVWASARTLQALPSRSWLSLSHHPELDRSLPSRLLWQQRRLDDLARNSCDLLFVPGGTYTGRFRPFVTMFHNMLPFDSRESKRYGISWVRLRLAMLRRMQSSSFARADGLIFLNQFSRDRIVRALGALRGRDVIVPHGIEVRFFKPPRQQMPSSYFELSRPFRVLYVSIVDMYKHQWSVVEAIAALRKKGHAVELDLVGPAYRPALRRLNEVIQRVDPASMFIRYRGSVSHAVLDNLYHDADAFVFASTCETMSNILLEAMASGLPVASSNRGPMPAILGEGGFFFDPEQSRDVVRVLEAMIADPENRRRSAEHLHQAAKQYSWNRSADDTFRFLAEIWESWKASRAGRG